VAGEETRALQLRHGIRADPTRFHEIQRFTDSVCNILELGRPRAAAHEIMRPGMDLMQVGIATPGKGAE
jgi:hypothetical protein